MAEHQPHVSAGRTTETYLSVLGPVSLDDVVSCLTSASISLLKTVPRPGEPVVRGQKLEE